MWLPYAIISMLTSGFRRVYDKNLSGLYGNFSIAFIFNFFALFPMVIAMFIFRPAGDIFHMPWQFWWPLLLSILIQYPLQNYLYIRAIREGEMSSIIPLIALIPVFNVLTSVVLVHEIPTRLGILGILIIVIGTYLILKKKGTHMKSRPELFMIGSVFLMALGSSFDKIALGVSEPMFYVFSSILGTAIMSLFLMFTAGEFHELKQMHAKPRHLFIVGILFAVSLVTLEMAFSKGPTSYVLALRTGSFFIGALLGFFKLKERFTIRKSVAILCFLSGSMLLAFA